MSAESKKVENGAKAVLVTGSSSGLGRAAALHLADLGYSVFAGVRTEDAASDLRQADASGLLRPVILDVTDASSIALAGKQIEEELDGAQFWAVVNNAGISVTMPLECVPIDVLRTQLETNLIGALAVTQRFLPLLRAAKGRIVNVSSGIGRIAPPYLGVYAASQFGKEGLSDSLRRELKPLGVSVSVIQPGAINTAIWDKMRTTADDLLAATPPAVADLYRKGFEGFLAANAARAAASHTRPEDFARTVASILETEKPKARYQVGLDSHSTAVAFRVLPDRLLDVVIAAGMKFTKQ
ncbi:SDR family oxidoreductase [Antrihabitans stalactiti]|uniref:SDR family oxidoreductase n=1 Tax=Antrihabitans stalactiti TaxID=2584121 RepID=A0A848KIC4_9NOCA|nr:SDR family oxidoreductase [Antrihabitans stalactiti]NMN98823.1 SDR family oxidoreductase [Antrihabitans stalactiti]